MNLMLYTTTLYLLIMYLLLNTSLDTSRQGPCPPAPTHAYGYGGHFPFQPPHPMYIHPPAPAPIASIPPKQIRETIMSMHQMLPFRLNDYSLITEKAGKDSNGFYTECAKSWLINPLITYAVLVKEEAGLFFAPLPTDRVLQGVGHQLCDVKAYPRAIRDLINKGRCAIYPQDIYRLQGFNYLYFSPALQNRIFLSLEHHYPPLSEALLIFTMEKFQWEREIFMHSQQQRAQSLFPSPAPAKAPPAQQLSAQPCPPAPTSW
jgi:hypothetical protein